MENMTKQELNQLGQQIKRDRQREEMNERITRQRDTRRVATHTYHCQ